MYINMIVRQWEKPMSIIFYGYSANMGFIVSFEWSCNVSLLCQGDDFIWWNIQWLVDSWSTVRDMSSIYILCAF